MKQRLITGIVLLAIFLPLLIVPELFTLFQILMVILCIVASYEMINLYEKEKKFPLIVKIFIMIASGLIYMSALSEWADFTSKSFINSVSGKTLELLNLQIGFLPILLLVFIILFSLMVFCKDFNGTDVGKALTAVCYTGLCFGALTILRFLGLRYIIYLFLITILTDVFAYLGGSKFGKHKMCPLISPHKTWEGAVIGSIVAVVVGALFAFFYGDMFGTNAYFNPEGLKTLFGGSAVFRTGNIDNLSAAGQFFAILGISVLVSITGQIGDLVASKLKRTVGLKDYGNIFPGHGGVLDRLDSAIFAALSLLLIFVLL